MSGANQPSPPVSMGNCPLPQPEPFPGRPARPHQGGRAGSWDRAKVGWWGSGSPSDSGFGGSGMRSPTGRWRGAGRGPEEGASETVGPGRGRWVQLNRLPGPGRGDPSDRARGGSVQWGPGPGPVGPVRQSPDPWDRSGRSEPGGSAGQHQQEAEREGERANATPARGGWLAGHEWLAPPVSPRTGLPTCSAVKGPDHLRESAGTSGARPPTPRRPPEDQERATGIEPA